MEKGIRTWQKPSTFKNDWTDKTAERGQALGRQLSKRYL
jgi:hypothetical protein